MNNRPTIIYPHVDGYGFKSYRWSSDGATVACWCDQPATLACPIDPAVTPWDERLRLDDGVPAMPYCDEHARDGYVPLGDFARVSDADPQPNLAAFHPRGEEAPAPAFDLGSWSTHKLRTLLAELDPEGINAPLVEAIAAELKDRRDRLPRDLDWSDVEADADRMRGEQEALEAASEVLAKALRPLEETGGMTELLEAVGPLAEVLPPALWEAVAERLDLCPVHGCDVEVCQDDQDPECPAGRKARADKEEGK